ncbi:MAG: thiamine phosphate synthase [Firmicutes bacterium]|nr:thiamine phosphate synthase [Bacillota bacterium]
MTLAERLRLYLVTDHGLAGGRDLATVVAAAIRGGVTAVQLRVKGADGRPMWEEARRLAALCRERGVLFIVNDRLDVALASGADGVHLGQTDLPVPEARRIARQVAGEGFVIGLSVDTEEQARAARAAGADYVGVGPVRATATKPDAAAPLGVEGTARVARAFRPGPAVAIGGVDAENARELIAAGLAGLAVVSAIMRAGDPERAAAEIRRRAFEGDAS